MYLSLKRIKQELGISEFDATQDVTLKNLIERVEREIDSYLSPQPVETQTVVHRFTGRGLRSVYLPFNALGSLTSASEEDESGTLTAMTDVRLTRVDGAWYLVKRDGFFVKGVVYEGRFTAGYADGEVPGDIVQSGNELVRLLYYDMALENGGSRFGVGQVSVNAGTGMSATTVYKPDQVRTTAYERLQRYRPVIM